MHDTVHYRKTVACIVARCRCMPRSPQPPGPVVTRGHLSRAHACLSCPSLHTCLSVVCAAARTARLSHAGARWLRHPVTTQFLCRNTRPPSLGHTLSRHNPRSRHRAQGLCHDRGNLCHDSSHSVPTSSPVTTQNLCRDTNSLS